MEPALIGVIVAFCLQAAGVIYAYGKLVERSENNHTMILDIQKEIRKSEKNMITEMKEVGLGMSEILQYISRAKTILERLPCDEHSSALTETRERVSFLEAKTNGMKSSRNNGG